MSEQPSPERLRLRRTDFPESLRDQTLGEVRTLGRYWFEIDGEEYGVSKQVWDHGVTWEVFHGWTMATIRDDYDTLRQVRREAEKDCRDWMQYAL